EVWLRSPAPDSAAPAAPSAASGQRVPPPALPAPAGQAGAARALRVAFAVFVTDVSNPAGMDALAVLAHGVRKAAARSRHRVDLLVLAPERLTEPAEKHLLEVGYKEVLKRPVPVPAEEVRGDAVRNFMGGKSAGADKFAFAEDRRPGRQPRVFDILVNRRRPSSTGA
ncbi:unnamed protein product, partial [Prorocentrum cordatum]